MVNEIFLLYSPDNEKKCIEEAMIPYYGSHGSKQRIQGKPIICGFKAWVMAENYGYVTQFDIYQGAKDGREGD